MRNASFICKLLARFTQSCDNAGRRTFPVCYILWKLQLPHMYATHKLVHTLLGTHSAAHYSLLFT